MPYDLSEIRRAHRVWARECGHTEDPDLGLLAVDKEVAKRAFQNGSASKLSRFLSGKTEARGMDINAWLRGWRRLAFDLTAAHFDSVKERKAEAEGIELDVCEALGIAGPLKARHFDLAAGETASLRRHDRTPFREFSDHLIRKVNTSRDCFAAACEVADIEWVEDPEQPPGDLPENHTVIDSTTCDTTLWQPVRDKEALRRKPIQACFMTRVVEVSDSVDQVALAFDTGGFGVFHLPSPSGSPSVKRAWATDKRWMDETLSPEDGKPGSKKPARGNVRTICLEYDLSEFPRKSRPPIVARVILYNGLQDQLHARLPTGERAQHDWLGKRVVKGTGSADLSVLLPASIGGGDVLFRKRVEGEWSTQAANLTSRLVFPADLEAAGTDETKTDETKAVWILPRVGKKKTIYSMWWSWKRQQLLG